MFILTSFAIEKTIENLSVTEKPTSDKCDAPATYLSFHEQQ